MMRTNRWGLGVGAAASLFLLVNLAHAEGPANDASATDAKPASGAAPSAKAPDSTASDADVIRLKNGGLVRGKISELIPGDSVTIVTITGKTREFSMSDVDYAGPVDADPQHQPAVSSPSAPAADGTPKAPENSSKDEKIRPYVTVHASEARLKLVSDDSGVTFHRQAASASSYAVGIGSSGNTAYAFGQATEYDRICTAPCEATLPAGTETLALSRDGKPPIPADAVTLPAGDSIVRGQIESRTGLRIAVVALGVVSAIGGVALVLTAEKTTRECNEFSECYDRKKANLPQLIGGAALIGVGGGLAVAVMLIPDKATIEVRPQSSAAPRPLALARGVALSGHF